MLSSEVQLHVAYVYLLSVLSYKIYYILNIQSLYIVICLKFPPVLIGILVPVLLKY